MIIYFFCFGPHPEVHRTYLWFYVQGSLLAWFRGPYGVSEIKPKKIILLFICLFIIIFYGISTNHLLVLDPLLYSNYSSWKHHPLLIGHDSVLWSSKLEYSLLWDKCSRDPGRLSGTVLVLQGWGLKFDLRHSFPCHMILAALLFGIPPPQLRVWSPVYCNQVSCCPP